MENNESLTSTPSQLGLLQETTKAERKHFVDNVIRQIEDGQVDALKVHLQVKGTESLIEMLTDKKKHPDTANRYSVLVLGEALRHGSKSFEMHNATFTLKEAGTTYDWKVCNDDEIIGLQELEKALKAQIKERQEFLKKVPAKGLEIVSKDTGEMVTVYPPAVSSTTIVATTLK